MISIRDAAAPDVGAIEEVRRASWRAAYAGLIGQVYLDRATSGSPAPPRLSSWRRTLVAVDDAGPAVVGYTSFGPERAIHPYVVGPPSPGSRPPRFTDAGSAGQAGEMYAIYLDPGYWSAGTGRALMDAAVAGLTAAGYQKAVLWVLEGNARARRFYEIAGWKPDGAGNRLESLGGVMETRYTRPLALVAGVGRWRFRWRFRPGQKSSIASTRAASMAFTAVRWGCIRAFRSRIRPSGSTSLSVMMISRRSSSSRM